jgi:hypothetical protein
MRYNPGRIATDFVIVEREFQQIGLAGPNFRQSFGMKS